MKQRIISIPTQARGLYSITEKVVSALGSLPKQGLLNCFVQHTSCSLIIQENADPTAKQDLEEFALRLSPDGELWHRHIVEGADDTTAHMNSAVFGCSLNIPIVDQRLGLGIWQGIYLWEHRTEPHVRKLVLTVIGEN